SVAVTSSLSPSLFFSSCSAAHPDLPSFPTRRSSDLLRRIISTPREPGDQRLVPRRRRGPVAAASIAALALVGTGTAIWLAGDERSEEHTSELQSRFDLVCRLLLEKKKSKTNRIKHTR